MDLLTGLTVANGLLQLYKTVSAEVQRQMASGVIPTVEEQKAYDEYKALQAELATGKLQGPQWVPQPMPEDPNEVKVTSLKDSGPIPPLPPAA